MSREGASGLPGRLALVGVSLAATLSALANRFTQDDLGLIANTERLHGLSHWREILGSPYWPPPYVPDLYRPVTSLLLAAQWTLGAGAPLIFRIGSALLYLLVTLAVYRLATRLLPGAAALGVALLFAAHPVHVEAVVQAVAQGELLVGLLAVLLVARYVGLRRTGDGRLAARDWAALGALYALAAFSKEQGLVLPALLLVAEVTLLSGSRRERLRGLLAGAASLGSVAAAVLLIRSAVLSGHALAAAPAPTLGGLTLAGRALTMLRTIPDWARLLLWPAHLRADYSPGEFVVSQGFGAREQLGLVILLLVLALAWAARRRAPAVTFGLAWAAIMLLPVSNLVIPTGILLAERTLFSPSIGVLIAVGGAAAFLIEHSKASATALRRSLAVGCGILVLAGVVRSAGRQRVYADSSALTLASLRDAPGSWRVQQAAGEYFFDQGRRDDGVQAYHRAIGLSPGPWYLRNSLAQRLRMAGDDAAALEELRLSLEEHPTQEALAQLAAALLAVGKYEQARTIAEGIIAREGAPPAMVWIKHLADSAIAVHAPPGSIRVGISTR